MVLKLRQEANSGSSLLEDGIYVTGHGFLYPCKDYEEAQKVIETLTLNISVKNKK